MLHASQESEIDSLKQVLRSTSEGETVDILNQLAEAHAGLDWEKSQRYAGLALDLATSLDDSYGIAVAHLNFAAFYNMEQDFRKALDHAAEALSLFEQLSDDWQIAKTLRTIGTTYSKLNQSDQSLDYFLRSLMIFEDINREKDIAATVMVIGDVYVHWDQAEKALRFFERALSIYQAEENYDQVLESGNRLAKTLMTLERFDEAKQYLDQMVLVSDQHPSPVLQAEIYASLGELFQYQSQLNTAQRYFLNALELKEAIGDQGEIALALSQVAKTYLEAGNVSQALSYYKQAQSMAESSGASNISAEVWLNIGALHMQTGDLSNTVSALESGLDIATSINDLNLMQRAYRLLTEAYGKFGQPDKALTYQQALQGAIDALNVQQSNRRVAELEIRYELDKMDRELDALKGQAIIEELRYKRRYTMMIVVIAFSITIMILLLFFLFYRSNLIQRTEKEKMEHALRMKADFTAMLVHDLRSPLTAVFGFAELLKMGEKSFDQIKQIAQTIRTASQKMLQLVNEMLDLSKFEAGKMALSKTTVTLKSLAATSLQMLEPVASKENMKISFQAADGLPSCQCDVLKIEQVITNLISNAINHTPAGSEINVKLEAKTIDEAEYIHFSVADNGPGVPEESVDKLFDKYAQLEARSSAKSKGTGLGLAVSRIIIEEHGGKIGYKDNDPAGSIFYFQIPVKDPGKD
ncbi:MAG: tetratricopeptide repeat-containing sensor histidine kinase [Candidatus Marinimicrobia bacterium]|nr:tetratricopeptide repeat-containing sensor histidine kinase [Candidatus Neomarinimicrobiota bacterium]MCF7904326.1 tetratricopeptide repeat-containing sensor histidine kinase [Candidatus Neomarinimicrobiota bacterium]